MKFISRNLKTKGIIIKRSNYGEADRILTVLTEKYGKIKILAKGIRKINSRRGGNVELLNYADITVYSSKNFDLLQEAQVLFSHQKIKENLKKTALAYHLCEIVDGLCPEKEINQNIFHIMLNNFQEIEIYTNNIFLFNTFPFKYFLIRELGYWPKDKEMIPQQIDGFLESLLERKLKSLKFIQKIS